MHTASIHRRLLVFGNTVKKKPCDGTSSGSELEPSFLDSSLTRFQVLKSESG